MYERSYFLKPFPNSVMKNFKKSLTQIEFHLYRFSKSEREEKHYNFKRKENKWNLHIIFNKELLCDTKCMETFSIYNVYKYLCQ